MAKILVVEDDRSCSTIICDALTAQSHAVEIVDEGAEALARLRIYKYDLVVLDWMLPKQTGMEVLQEFRKVRNDLPVLMLTARGASADKEAGLNAGADDYLTKPFEPRELCSRVRALLRRSDISGATAIRCRHITIDPLAHRVFCHGQEVTLQPMEYSLLHFLICHPDRVFTHETLMTRVWDDQEGVTAEAVRKCVERIRKKLDRPDTPSLIATVRGVGYILRQKADDGSVAG